MHAAKPFYTTAPPESPPLTFTVQIEMAPSEEEGGFAKEDVYENLS